MLNHQYPNKNVKSVLELVTKFRETGSAANKNENFQNPAIRTEAVDVAVFGHVAVDATISTTILALYQV